MDLDAYVLQHMPTWLRLQELTRRRRLDGPASDELMDLYQQVATHLSVVRTSAPDPSLVTFLSSVLAKARTRSSGTRTSTWRGFATFWTDRFPAALYRLRWWWLATMAANYLLVGVMIWWMLGHPEIEQNLMTPGQVDQLVSHDFENYYSEYASSDFALRVWVNNAWVTAQCLAFGALGFPVIIVLWNNMVNLAAVGAILINHDHGAHFFGLILPHGLLELTAVFIAGGVGLRLFWSWVSPGALPRTKSFAHEGRTAGTVALGLVAVLAVSGAIEGFVTGSSLPTWSRVGIGILAEVVFFAYVYILGRRAYLAGHTGDIDAALLEDKVATVD